MALKHSALGHPREKMVYSDVDGTLVSDSNELHTAVIKQIEHFVERGFGFSLATGRSLEGVTRIMQQLPLNAPLVLCNGAYIYDPDSQQALWTAISKDIVSELLLELMDVPRVRISVERSDQSLWVSRDGAMLDPFIRQEGLKPIVWQSMKDVLEGADILKVGVKLLEPGLDVYEHMTGVLNELQMAADDRIRWCFSSNSYIEVLADGVSKWSGILQSQQMQGFRDSFIYTIGDHQNDKEMIQNADVGVAMGNAIEEVQKVADYTIGTVDEQAAAEWLEKLMSGRESNPKQNVTG